MGKEIVINAQKDQTRIAIVENGDLAEMYIESPENERTIGDIYLARVRKIMPSIQAAFVDIGQKQDAFLHFSDVADNLADLLAFLKLDVPEVGKVDLTSDHRRSGRRRRPRGPSGGALSMSDEEDQEDDTSNTTKRRSGRGASQRHKRRSAQQKSRQSKNASDSQEKSDEAPAEDFRPERVLKKDQKILVKIVKEPISNKGSRVSTDISLAGRFLVLVPLADYVAVSKKIVSFKERRRLRTLAKSLLPKGFGVIVRTVAEGKDAKTLDTDLRLLVEKWRRIEKALAPRPTAPAVLYQDVSMVSSVIRDLFSDDYESILVDDQRMFRNIKGYVNAVAPQMAPAVRIHKGDDPVFQHARIDRSVAQAFQPRVDLPSGGYLIIEHTEAMHVVDVNSGRAGKGLSQEVNSLKVNLEAARVIAQQLRLRDLGGIIVIDFIDLREDKNRRKVFDEMRTQFRRDRAVTKLLPMSDFGVMQITRQRLRPSITTLKQGPNGRSEPPKEEVETAPPSRKPRTKPKLTTDELVNKIDTWLARYREGGQKGPLLLKLHPFTAAYVQKRLPITKTRWYIRHRIKVRIEIDEEMEPMAFRFYDVNTGQDLSRRRSSRGRGGGRRDEAKPSPASGEKTPSGA